ncbi:MAG: hypothetical protein ABIM89_06220 [Mycobacteriales bacterium]
MSRRIAAVLAMAGQPTSAPPGIDPHAFALALIEDAADGLNDLDQCESAIIACPPAYAAALRSMRWPGSHGATVEAGETAQTTAAALAAVHQLGASDAVVVAGDAPDLPGLLVGKLFSALTGADIAVCPAHVGLVALAARLPAAQWFLDAGVGLDTAGALAQLTAAAPRADALVVVSGWHRLRTPDDIRFLDYGLEGWDATRALLGGY